MRLTYQFPGIYVFIAVTACAEGNGKHKYKNRAHIDLDVTDLEVAIRRVVDLGGTKLDEFSKYGITWAVMADPDGNEFCLGPAFVSRIKPCSVFKTISIITDNAVRQCADRSCPVVPNLLVHIRPRAVVEFCLVMIIKTVQNRTISPN